LDRGSRVRSWRRAAQRRKRRPPRCTSCGERIPRSEPDVSLEHHEAPGKLYFHERCALDACTALVRGSPGVWMLTHRHINPEAN
jgi:hypothetical protein